MVAGTLIFNATGRPHAVCPRCGRMHAVMRRKDYLDKAPLRFQCKNKDCRTTWRSTEDERKAVLDYYNRTQAEREKRRARAQQGVENRRQKVAAAAGGEEPPKKRGILAWLTDDDE